MRSLRLFTAVSLNDELRNLIGDVLRNGAKLKAPVKWVEPHQLHMTLFFLGSQPEERLALIMDSLDKPAEKAGSFTLELDGIGAFPSLERPKVIFMPALEGKEALCLLASGISGVLTPLGIQPEEREYHAHVTLGRVKEPKGMENVLKRLEEGCPPVLGKMAVDHFSLFESRLTEKGPIYTELKKYFFPKG